MSGRGRVDDRTGEAVRRRAVGDEDAGTAVGDQIRQPLRRVRRVEGYVCRTGPQDAQQRRDHRRRAGQADGDQVLRSGTQGAEPVRQTVGPGVEFRVGVRAGVVGERDRVRPQRRLARHQIGYRWRRLRDRRVVPRHEDPVPVGFRHERQVPQRCVRIGQRTREQRPERVDEPPRGVRLEQVGAVLQCAAQAAAVPVVREHQRQVVLGDPGGAVQFAQGQARQHSGRRPGVAQREHRAEHRCPARVAGRVEVLDEPLEGQARVGERADRDVAHLPQVPAEGELGPRPSAQRQHVDEEADQRLQVGVVATGDRGTDDDVRHARVPGQHDLVRGEQHHERRGALATRQLGEVGQLVRRDVGRYGTAHIGRSWRAWPVGR
ncbi:MAG: hypothetical protein AUG44_00035 [Actinobacteria bacterium 13_1_20CM_3_71_11]|nr:MAG: hypothetical protein AUG44_00035 [Actinobacteria bacterium 13_1_20CM_3_71_11]